MGPSTDANAASILLAMKLGSEAGQSTECQGAHSSRTPIRKRVAHTESADEDGLVLERILALEERRPGAAWSNFCAKWDRGHYALPAEALISPPADEEGTTSDTSSGTTESRPWTRRAIGKSQRRSKADNIALAARALELSHLPQLGQPAPFLLSS